MADTGTQVPDSVKAEGEQPRPEYAVIPSQRAEPEANFVAHPFLSTDAGAAPQGQNAAADASAPKPRLAEASIQRFNKFTASPTRVYAAIGVGMGLMAGLTLAAVLVHPGGQSASNDLGAVTSNANGLKGHLTLKWGDRLGYHLTVEPSNPAQRVAFATAVNASPLPLSLAVQLKDPFGVVLCGNTILLKFDPRNAVPGVATDPEPRNKKAAEDLAVRNQIAQSINLARLESEEIDREHGKDIFQNDIGPDGNLASISAQGTLPCSKKQYDNTASWSFKTDFPAIAPLVGAANSMLGAASNGDQAASLGSADKTMDASKSSSAKNTRRQIASSPSRIYIEGDDAIIWYDAVVGIAETSAGKFLVVEKKDALANSLKGRDLPIDIHYTCDQAGACTFAGAGLGIQHARLRR